MNWFDTKKGKAYAVTATTDCRITTLDGIVLGNCPAETQIVVIAPSDDGINVDDDNAIVTECFKGASPSALGGGAAKIRVAENVTFIGDKNKPLYLLGSQVYVNHHRLVESSYLFTWKSAEDKLNKDELNEDARAEHTATINTAYAALLAYLNEERDALFASGEGVPLVGNEWILCQTGTMCILFPYYNDMPPVLSAWLEAHPEYDGLWTGNVTLPS